MRATRIATSPRFATRSFWNVRPKRVLLRIRVVRMGRSGEPGAERGLFRIHRHGGCLPDREHDEKKGAERSHRQRIPTVTDQQDHTRGEEAGDCRAGQGRDEPLMGAPAAAPNRAERESQQDDRLDRWHDQYPPRKFCSVHGQLRGDEDHRANRDGDPCDYPDRTDKIAVIR